MDRLERLVNLVAALIDTDRPLTRAAIHERIDGYSSDEEAFRRNFERDKDLLRQMGFPLLTEATDPNYPDELGYRIPREQYELPDPGLDEAELSALRLAASAVQVEGEWGPKALTLALSKLGGAVDGPGSHEGSNPSSRHIASLPGDEAAAIAYGAAGERRRVRFEYRGETRVVDPWRLSFHRGHWYLSGHDHGRGEERQFRLDRLTGPLTAEGPPGVFDRPATSQVGPPQAWRLGEEEEVVARLLVEAEQAHWARQALGEDSVTATHPDGSIECAVGVTNREAFLSFVFGFLDHAEILGPPELREGIVRWLETLADGGRHEHPSGGRTA